MITKLSLSSIRDVKICGNTSKKTLVQIKEETGADYIFNGSLFNLSSFSPASYLVANGETLSTAGDGFGYAFGGGKILFSYRNNVSLPDFIGGYPLLVKDGKKAFSAVPAGLEGKRGRTAMGVAGDKLVLFCTDDSEGLTLDALAGELIAAGCVSAINLDGGGSSQCDFSGNTVASARRVYNYICIWLKKRICIDPGHGGSDPGAVGRAGTRESAVVLDTALKLRAELHAQGFETMMTREGDAYKTPIERTDLSNSRNADLFVSLHANSFTSAAANGTETYCLSPGGQGEKLAGAVQLRLIEAVALKNRGTKTASFYVLRKTNAPAILCELAFISNAGEEKLLASNEYRTAWGRAICLGICDYYGILYDGGSVSGGETAFEPYRVRVTEPVRVYLEPRGLKEVLQISSGVYTVIDKDGSYGKLKSGAGWIFLRDVERL